MSLSLALRIALNHHLNDRGEPIRVPRTGYLAELYQDAWSEPVVIMKSTQSGISEWLIITMFALAEIGLNHFYVLPTEQLRNRFLSNRIDKLKNRIPFYRSRMSDTDNKSLKIYNGVALAFVGSNSPAGFIEFSADVATIDELDRCSLVNLDMVPERLAASKYRIIRRVSNPTVSGLGIAAEYAKSDQRKWNIKGPCGHWNIPDFFQNLVTSDGEAVRDPSWEPGKEPSLLCAKCDKPFDRFGAGEWVQTSAGSVRGYHVSKLFSTRVSLAEILSRFEAGTVSDIAMQRFYNGDLGLPYTASGSHITLEMLDGAIGSHRSGIPSGGVIGIDPGNKIHYVVLDYNYRLMDAGFVHDENGIDEIMRRYNIRVACIDSMPEISMVRSLQRKHQGMFRVRYLTDSVGRTEAVVRQYGQINIEKGKLLQVNRTMALDMVKDLLIQGRMILPVDAAKLSGGELYAHLQASVRIWDDDREQYRWVETGPDHLHHAAGYAICANNIRLQLDRFS